MSRKTQWEDFWAGFSAAWILVYVLTYGIPIHMYLNRALVERGWAHYDTKSGKLVEDKRQ